jgi:CBS domain-containing protein
VFSNRVAWTRGHGCLDLATTLSDDLPIAVTGDLRTACIEHRVEFLVAKKFTGFDLVPMIVPSEVDLAAVDAVTAAGAEGPHSPLAVEVAARIGRSLNIPVSAATAYHTNEDQSVATDRLELLTNTVDIDVDQIAIPSGQASAIVESLTPTTLLVIGAPGGSWFQRQLSGPGHKLVVAAPAGAVLVRAEPRRCFMDAHDPASAAMSVHLTLRDAKRMMQDPVAPVVEEGKLVGIVRKRVLFDADDALSVGDIMESSVSVDADEPTDAAAELSDFLDGGPIPVVDQDRLVGVIRP